jgi:hypothetical protein
MNKDHDDVVRFLTLFAKLRIEIENDPSNLVAKAEKSESLRKLCLAVSNAAWPLRHAESRHRQKFAYPVDPTFKEAWRTFELSILRRSV